MKEKDFVSSLKKGLMILAAFDESNPFLTLTDLCKRTNLPKTTVFRLCRTLVALEYLKYDSSKHTYQPGIKVLSLGFNVLASMELRDIASPYLIDLFNEVNENVNLSILDDIDVVYIERLKKREILNIALHVGSRLKAVISSSGRVILAFLDKKELDKILQHKNLNNFFKEHNKDDFIKMLERIREKGYSVVDGEYFPGLVAVAAPVLNRKNKVVAAVNIPFLKTDIDVNQKVKTLIEPLLKCVKKIGKTLPYD
ncbi:MAG: IclR family transcriptional regulator [Deltaproteobacteria bacterium]|nr:IclR family transcriptional regulator [Deltaproteobacteria bacterium]